MHSSRTEGASCQEEGMCAISDGVKRGEAWWNRREASSKYMGWPIRPSCSATFTWIVPRIAAARSWECCRKAWGGKKIEPASNSWRSTRTRHTDAPAGFNLTFFSRPSVQNTTKRSQTMKTETWVMPNPPYAISRTKAPEVRRAENFCHVSVCSCWTCHVSTCRACSRRYSKVLSPLSICSSPRQHGE